MGNENELRAQVSSLHLAVRSIARERDTAISERDAALEEVELLRKFIEGWTGRLPEPAASPGAMHCSSFGAAGALLLEGFIKKRTCEELDKSLARFPRRT